MTWIGAPETVLGIQASVPRKHRRAGPSDVRAMKPSTSLDGRAMKPSTSLGCGNKADSPSAAAGHAAPTDCHTLVCLSVYNLVCRGYVRLSGSISEVCLVGGGVDVRVCGMGS